MILESFHVKALQRHCSSKNFSPCLSIPQTFSQLPSWPVYTKDEDPNVGLQMCDVFMMFFLLVTKNKFHLRTGYIQNNFLIDLISWKWLAANMCVQLSRDSVTEGFQVTATFRFTFKTRMKLFLNYPPIVRHLPLPCHCMPDSLQIWVLESSDSSTFWSHWLWKIL